MTKLCLTNVQITFVTQDTQIYNASHTSVHAWKVQLNLDDPKFHVNTDGQCVVVQSVSVSICVLVGVAVVMRVTVLIR